MTQKSARTLQKPLTRMGGHLILNVAAGRDSIYLPVKRASPSGKGLLSELDPAICSRCTNMQVLYTILKCLLPSIAVVTTVLLQFFSFLVDMTEAFEGKLHQEVWKTLR